MAEIFLRDQRVTGSENLTADINMLIRESDDLGQKLSELAEQIDRNINTAVPANLNYLHILCHGLPEGLQLGGAPAINHNRVGVFRPLHQKIGHIIIHGCRAALIYPGGNNGALMCQRLAVTVNARVTASDATQYYLAGSSIHNLSGNTMLVNWRGNVGTWNERGQLVNLSTADGRSSGQGISY